MLPHVICVSLFHPPPRSEHDQCGIDLDETAGRGTVIFALGRLMQHGIDVRDRYVADHRKPAAELHGRALFPDIKFIFLHGGGTMPFLVEQMTW